jgi:peptidoglycan/LPS O-acetylase OafA/YrhL
MRDRLNALTSVRFFAALWVIAYHQSASNGWLFGTLSAGPLPIFHGVQTGYVAVGMFFVLSGFILAYTYSKPPLRTRSFLTARFARIYPVYVLGLVLALPAVVFPWRHHHLPPTGTAIGSLVLPVFLLQAWHPSYALVFNGPGWSLSAETFFYLMFPLLIPMIRGRTRPQLLGALVIAGALSVVVPLVCICLNIQWFGRVPAWQTVGDQTWPNVAQFNPLFRLPDFLFGVIVAGLFRTRPVLSNQPAQGWKWYLPGMVGIAAGCGVLCEFIPHPLFDSFLLPFFGMLIYGLACGGGPIERAMSNRWLVRLGEASYAMYILHSPLVWWTYWIDGKGPNLIHSHPMVVFCLYLIVVVACSLLVYRFVEEPARQYLRNKLSGKPKPPIHTMQPSVVLI